MGTSPVENLEPGTVVRVKDGGWRMLVREGATGATGTVYDQVPGIGWVPEEEVSISTHGEQSESTH